jgi:hypothetical protein
MSATLEQSENPISAEEYHKLPGISNSRLSVFIEDPRKYHYQFLSGQYVEEQKGHFDFGGVFHDISLLGESNFRVIPQDVLAKNGARLGNAWKEFRDANEDKTLLKAEDYQAVMRCVAAVKNHPLAGSLLSSPGKVEHCFEAVFDGLICRCRPDKICYWNGRTVVIDLKSTTDTMPSKFVKSIERFGYHRQEYFYRKVLAANGINIDAFVFIAVNSEEPHCVDCYELDQQWLSYAAEEVDPAMRDLLHRELNNDWRSYTEESFVRVSPPDYMKFKGQYAL